MDSVKAYEDALKTGHLDGALEVLYGTGGLEVQKRRYARLLDTMVNRFAPAQITVVIAPGRTELGGNHTDHNHGRVLAAAVHLDCVAMAAPAEGARIAIESSALPEIIRVDLSSLAPRPDERGRPEALVRGVAAGLVEQGHRIGGFAACVDSTVPPGTGLSSSAAFELLLGGVLYRLFNHGALPVFDLARIAKQAENEFFGKPCGFMDQLVSGMGGIRYLDFKDPLDPDVDKIDFDFTRSGYEVAVVDTGGSHAELTPAYAAVNTEMQTVARSMGKTVLRGMDLPALIREIPRLRRKTGDRALLRAIHFVEENDRVGAMVEALRHNRMDRYLKQVSASGDASWRLLQNCYCPSTPREQGIPLALTLSDRFLDGRGAGRVHGGGFEGAIQVYVPRERFNPYRQFMEKVFGPGAVTILRMRRHGLSVLTPHGLEPSHSANPY